MSRLARTTAIVAAGLGLALAGCANGVTPTADTTEDTEAGTVTNPKDITEDFLAGLEDEEDDTSADTPETSKDIDLVVTQAEPVSKNAAWCGTMQLCWNSLVNDLNSGKPVIFDDASKQTPEIGHMNDMLFTTANLSDDHYYTYTGPMTLDAKAEIEDAISKRFNQKSDILDQFTDWGAPDAQFLYAMLYRQFSFSTPFSISSSKGWFGSDDNDNRAQDVAYFETSNDEQREQVIPLYYADDEHHAVSITTADGDELILVREPEGETLDEMWQNAMQQSKTAKSDETKPLGEKETFKCPNLDISLDRSYDEWTGSMFTLTGADGKSGKWMISQALQTLKLHLDNEGGEVKSEAGIAVVKSAPMGKDTSRHFAYDDTFAMFIRDGKATDDSQPYVGVLVSDITQFQPAAEKV